MSGRNVQVLIASFISSRSFLRRLLTSLEILPLQEGDATSPGWEGFPRCAGISFSPKHAPINQMLSHTSTEHLVPLSVSEGRSLSSSVMNQSREFWTTLLGATLTGILQVNRSCTSIRLLDVLISLHLPTRVSLWGATNSRIAAVVQEEDVSLAVRFSTLPGFDKRTDAEKAPVQDYLITRWHISYSYDIQLSILNQYHIRCTSQATVVEVSEVQKLEKCKCSTWHTSQPYQ